MDDIEEFIVDTIRQASRETIPSLVKSQIQKPWVNQEYQELLSNQRQERDPGKRRAIGDDIKKLRTRLKNTYFKTKADNINVANENRHAEEEFRLMKQHTSLNILVHEHMNPNRS